MLRLLAFPQGLKRGSMNLLIRALMHVPPETADGFALVLPYITLGNADLIRWCSAHLRHPPMGPRPLFSQIWAGDKGSSIAVSNLSRFPAVVGNACKRPSGTFSHSWFLMALQQNKRRYSCEFLPSSRLLQRRPACHFQRGD